MYLEQEACLYMIIDFVLVIMIGVVMLGLKYKKQIIRIYFGLAGRCFLVLTFYFCFKCIINLPNDPSNFMYTEEQSVIFANTGICWAISMLFEFIGIVWLVKSKK